MIKNNYELWQVINDGFEFTPLVLINNYDNYSTAYTNYLEKMKEMLCVIICRSRPIQLTEEGLYIYESPNGGKTIYRRESGNYDDRDIIDDRDYKNIMTEMDIA